MKLLPYLAIVFALVDHVVPVALDLRRDELSALMARDELEKRWEKSTTAKKTIKTTAKASAKTTCKKTTLKTTTRFTTKCTTTSKKVYTTSSRKDPFTSKMNTTPVIATTPKITTPVITTPVITTPVITTPVITTPVITTPEITTPVITTTTSSAPPTCATNGASCLGGVTCCTGYCRVYADTYAVCQQCGVKGTFCGSDANCCPGLRCYSPGADPPTCT